MIPTPNEAVTPAKTRSEELFEIAKTLLPGGVSSPVRAIKPYPFYVDCAKGAYLKTADGKTLLDCCLGYGPLLLGHAHPTIQEAISQQLEKGWLYGTPTELEIELAKLITRDYTSIDMVRFCSSGSEATMAALRLARGYTGKSDIVKVAGGFHGAHDAVLIKAGSGATTMGIPDSAGVLSDVASHTHSVAYNDAEELETLLSKNADIAAFIIEPIMANIGPILPKPGYLKDIREITAAHDVLLIFDEVITGYRIGRSGAQGYYGIRPDLTTLGKIVGGGLPLGVFSGKREIMECTSPQGPVYNAGTFNGHPLSMAAGIATLNWIFEHETMYSTLAGYTQVIADTIADIKGHSGTFVSIGSLFKYFFREKAPQNYFDAKECNTDAFLELYMHMNKNEIFIPPSQFETNFLSFAHAEDEIEKICVGYETALK
ncbi:MAG: glutamate-1-semialdehyde 2,1-aminomutase [Methanomicrobiales archaeon]|jgi:glutamate-1-semialdehyde 2,1-aminomutase|nr:glutamate-1-semialdehyde 2,1-aminomutase [Methanomicrobiales archaeon]